MLEKHTALSCKRKGFRNESLFYYNLPKCSYKNHTLCVWSAIFPLVACNLLHEQTTHGTLFNLSGIHDFVRSVHLDARPNHARSIIYPFRAFTISCNKLHATITWFKIIYQRKNILTARFTCGLLFL